MKSKLFEYFKHLLVIILDYGQFKKDYSRFNLRVQQFVYLAVGILLPLEAVLIFIMTSEVLNFILWYSTQRDGDLQDRKKEMLEEVAP